MKNIIQNKTLDEERALYGVCDTLIKNCTFAGETDGESALKECRNIGVENCSFSLRYPLWHAENFYVKDCKTDAFARAALWFCKDGEITLSTLEGIKVLRECERITVRNCNISSPESFWKCKNVTLNDCEIISEYLLLGSSDFKLKNVKMSGKYSFQYVENGVIENSTFDTKDAFWNSKNVYVKDSVLKGEYLGWYSDGLTLENCVICGTQPLCYCKNLKLINCRTEGCDLAFEMSDVEATIIGDVLSVKNPKSGFIEADFVGEVIKTAAPSPCTGKVIIRNKKAI
ncbi:MAG: DUF3737 family protein [Clostridia bacterium]|nr:DUF3737 family protein [Clostridia bacterium]